jgi:hypothetical protein
VKSSTNGSFRSYFRSSIRCFSALNSWGEGVKIKIPGVFDMVCVWFNNLDPELWVLDVETVEFHRQASGILKLEAKLDGKDRKIKI